MAFVFPATPNGSLGIAPFRVAEAEKNVVHFYRHWTDRRPSLLLTEAEMFEALPGPRPLYNPQFLRVNEELKAVFHGCHYCEASGRDVIGWPTNATKCTHMNQRWEELNKFKLGACDIDLVMGNTQDVIIVKGKEYMSCNVTGGGCTEPKLIKDIFGGSLGTLSSISGVGVFI